MLLSEVRYKVLPNGALRIRKRTATQALTADVEEVAVGGFYFDDTMKVRGSRVWHAPPGEKGQRSWVVPGDFTEQDAFLTDSKVRYVAVAGIEKGSLVFFEFEASDEPPFLSLGNLFYEGVPTLVSRFELETPPGWTVRAEWLRREGPEPGMEGDVRTWELSNLSAPEPEPLGPDPAEEAPLLAIHVVPPVGVETIPATFTDWTAFSRWYEELARDRVESTPEIAARAGEVLAGEDGDFLRSLRAAGTYVRDQVRYVAVELGIGGFQPRPASSTLRNLYGDCKDKGTLFQSFLATREISSYPVLVNLTRRETVSEHLPVWGFNHLVVAVPLPADLDVPETFSHSVLDAGDLGRLMIVDTTDEMTSIGSLSAHLAGKRALVVAGPRGRVLTLPPADASAHRIDRRITMTLAQDGSLGVERVSKYRGEFAARARAEFGHSAVERRNSVEGRIADLWPDATIEGYGTDYETEEGDFLETVLFRSGPGPSLASGGRRVALFPGAGEEVARVPLNQRKTAVDYEHPMTIRYEIALEGLPAEVPVPESRSMRGEGWSVTSEYDLHGDLMTGTWEARLSRTRFEPDSFPELRKLWSALASASRETLAMPH